MKIFKEDVRWVYNRRSDLPAKCKIVIFNHAQWSHLTGNMYRHKQLENTHFSNDYKERERSKS